MSEDILKYVKLQDLLRVVCQITVGKKEAEVGECVGQERNLIFRPENYLLLIYVLFY